MATESRVVRHPDGSATVYGSFGEIRRLPSKPEDPSRWHPPMLSDRDLCSRYGVTLEDLLGPWHNHGFPGHIRKVFRTTFGNWRGRYTYEWRPEDVQKFEHGIRAIAEKIPPK